MKLHIYFTVQLFVCTKCTIFPPQTRYLEKQKIECGIIPNVNKGESKTGTNSRIINGEPTNKNYPTQVALTRKGTAGKVGLSHTGYCGGSLITDKAVLTAAHCICYTKDASTSTESWPATCKLDASTSNSCVKYKTPPLETHTLNDNQNREGINENHIELGDIGYKWDLQYYGYDNRIKSILYKYKEHRKNSYESFPEGDVGLIIKDDPIITTSMKSSISPICLPAPDMFEFKEAMPAVLVGWGDQRYHKDENDHSCYTNGARIKTVDTNKDNAEGIFGQCKRYKSIPSRYCSDIGTDAVSFSTKLQISFTSTAENRNVNIKGDADDDVCHEFFRPAKAAFYKYYSSNPSPSEKQPLSFDVDVARIKLISKGKDEQIKTIICFNLINVAKHGVCETNDNSWGFCSYACVASIAHVNEKYKTLPLYYHENLPKGMYKDDLFPNKYKKEVREKFHNTFKCIYSKPPLLYTAEFEINPNRDEAVTYLGIHKDTESPDEKTGYRGTNVGDSGSPIFVIPGKNTKAQRYTILAVHSGKPYDPLRKETNFDRTKLVAGDKCRGLVTKISFPILKWIQRIALVEKEEDVI